ncbi:MAG: LamG-like jellyroll fold domain-containing protein [Candidatus Falkowbacteria bacterium]
MMKKIISLGLLVIPTLFLPLKPAAALPLGTLLYRTSGGDKMYGYNTTDLIVAEKGKLAHIYSGHTAIYVGQENGVDYIVEMQPKGAIKVPAKYFINESLGEKLVGAKLPSQASPLQIAKAVAIAKNLANNNLAYDFDFKYQKGPQAGQWICSGLTEKVYESANISNPTNLNSLEYDPNYYAVDITPDGYDNEGIYNSAGDCFSENREYSKITRKTDMLIPAPELIGYDVGLEFNGDRYIFLPYTQYLQSSLKDVPIDITLASSFSEPEVRGNSPILGLILKWSLINNPISTVKNLASKVSDGLIAIKNKVFPDNSVALADNSSAYDFGAASTATKTATSKVTATKATSSKTSSTKVATTKTATTKASGTKIVAVKTPVIKATTTTSSKTTTPKASVTPATSTASVVNTTTKKTAVAVVRTTAKPTVTSATKATTTVSHTTSTPVVTASTTPAATSTVEESEVIPDSVESSTPVALIAKIYSNDGDDWLEIVNTSDQDFDLAAAGYRLEKAKTAADPTLIMRFGDEADGVYPGGTIISAYGSYLVASSKASEETKARADAISTKDTFSWTDDAYTIYLGTAAISSDDDSDIVDKLGYGTALYFEGRAPAPALKPGYALERRASATSTVELLATGGLQEFWPRLFNSHDNSADFLLIPYDLAVIESENSTTDKESTSSDLFVNPPGLNSEDLSQLWHFDECYGTTAANELQLSGQNPMDLNRFDRWLPGKWGCAAGLSYTDTSTTKGIFSGPLDPNQFSLNFYYKNDSGNFNLFLNFSNPASSGQQAYLEFSPYYTSISGFPGPEGRLNTLVWPSDGAWHQITLVVNRSGNYWSLYLDGQEVYRYEYSGIMPTFAYFEMGNKQNEAIAVDELSMWSRSLPETEIRTINLLNQPFNPYAWPTPQKVAKLEHYWSFNENAGTLTKDLVSSNDMPLKLEQWDMEGKSSSSLMIGSTINLPLANLSVTDLSLSFWWRNTSSPNEGRLQLRLLKDNTRTIMSLKPTIYNATFGFNDYGEYFVPYGQSFFPTDNKWHHLALTYDSYRYQLKFYLDGELKLERQLVKLRTGEEINNLEIVQENWLSSLDELKIWSGTLSAAQVLAEYNN